MKGIMMDGNVLELNGRKYDLSRMNPNSKIKIAGRSIRVKDIPHDVYTLACGHIGRGFFVQLNDIIFCQHCQETKSVARVKR